MRIGILGSGLMGGKLGTIWVRAGHEVIFSYARSEQKLQRLAQEAKGKARAGTPREAAQAAVVVVAVHWSRIDDVLEQAGDLEGKIVVSCSLPMNADDTGLVVAHTSSGARRWPRRCRIPASSARSYRAQRSALGRFCPPGASPTDRASCMRGRRA